MTAPIPIPDLNLNYASSNKSSAGGSAYAAPVNIGDFMPKNTSWLMVGVLSVVIMGGLIIAKKV